jgi:predicted phosphodiesterase
MYVAVISDLHLGPTGPADSFGHDDFEFLRFLTFLEHNFERIVLLGDIWETLTGRLPARPEQQLIEARRAHAEIAQRFRRPAYTYVFGNHDLIVGRIERAQEELLIDADGVKILFTHGHQSDGLLNRARWMSEIGVWIGGWIRRLGLASVYALLRRLDELRHGHTLDSAACAFQGWAIQVARRRSADVVVTGHTHLATRATHGDRLFLNSGSCSEGNISFLSIDTHAARYAVHSGF